MKMKLSLIVIAFISSLSVSAQDKNKDLDNIVVRYQEEIYRLDPVSAMASGIYDQNDQLPVTFTDSYREHYRKLYTESLTALSKINREKLNENDKLSYDIFKWQTEMAVKALNIKSNRLPISQFVGMHINFPQFGNGSGSQPFKTYKDYENWISRASKFPVYADSIIVYFRKGISEKILLPKSLVAKLIPQLESFVTDDPENVFFDPLKKFPPSFSQNEKDELTVKLTAAVKKSIIPSYKKLYDFIKGEYYVNARESSGLGDLPGGKDWYPFNVRLNTTTAVTPEEIFNIGLSEVKRIHAEMEKIKIQVGFSGSLSEFFVHLRTDPKFFPYKTPEEILSAYKSIETRIAPRLKEMFLSVPRTSFEVRQTEAFRAASAAAQYHAGLPDGSRPGIFYVPIIDATKVSVRESLFIHEAVPGHHYQVMLQRENDKLPEFRRVGFFTAYSEGWGLYSESLGKDLGLYTDPYQYMHALGDELFRAIRLVVDPGLHHKGWTREQAIKYITDNSAIGNGGATAEIERYMAIPGQAVSYKIGSMKILELKDRYLKMLGNKFRIAEFHDEILKDGAMPLELLERKMDAWALKLSKKKS